MTTHAELCVVALRWLCGASHTVYGQDYHLWHHTGGCAIAGTELSVGTEEPDAIGWTMGGVCILVECKVSRSDFLRDGHKTARRHGRGLGDVRWYLTTPGVIRDGDDLGPWGHAELRGRRVHVVRWPVHITDAEQVDRRANTCALIRCARVLAKREGEIASNRSRYRVRDWPCPVAEIPESADAEQHTEARP